MRVNGGFMGTTPVLACVIGQDYDKLARVQSSIIDTKNGVCYFPAYPPFTEEVLRDLGVLFGKLEYSDKAKEILDASNKLTEMWDKKIYPLEYQPKTTAYAHQKESFLYAYTHPRAALFLDPGLGKSKIAIDLLDTLGKKTLVLAPPSLLTNWESELAIHSNKELRVITLNDTSAAKKKEKVSGKIDCDVFLCGYETASRYYQEIFTNFAYDTVIMDESHRAKSISSGRTKAAIELSKKASRRVILSGTAVLQSPTDLYPQLKILSPQILNQDYHSFCRKYITYASWNNRIPVGVQNLDILNKRVRKFSIRYKLEECLTLPDRQILDIPIAMNSEQWKMYHDVMSDKDLYLPEGVISKEYKMVALAKLNQITGGFIYISQKDPKICDGCPHVSSCVETSIKAYTQSCSIVQKAPPNKVIRFKDNPKLEATMALVEEILQTEDGRVIIWTKAIEEKEMLKERLTAEKIGYCLIESDPKNDLKPLESGEVRVGISNVAQGTGYTANFARYMIYYGQSFSLEHYLQSIARNYRIGQKEKVVVYRLLAQNTIDERIVKALDNKQDIAEALLTNLECTRCKNMSKCAMLGIFQYDKQCVLSKKKSLDVGEK